MEIVAIVLGISLILFAAVDAISTILTLTGGGPITRYVAHGLWAMMSLLRRHTTATMVKISGPAILLSVFAVWTLLIWTGWTLIFFGIPDGVVESQSGRPANFWQNAYYTGFLLTTLGVGDYRPQGTTVQMLSIIASGTGFFFITLSVTYLLSLLSAVVAKRALAFSIFSLGRTPQEQIQRGWNHADLAVLSEQISDISENLVLLAQHHLAYPILHYFQTGRPHSTPTIAVAVLDESLTILLYGIESTHRPNALPLLRARDAIELYTDTLDVNHKQVFNAPPPPALEPLRKAGLPVVEDLAFINCVNKFERRRGKLRALTERDGWSWATVIKLNQSSG